MTASRDMCRMCADTRVEGKVGWGEATLEGHDLAIEGALDEIIVRIKGLEAKSIYELGFQLLLPANLMLVTLSIYGS